MPMNNKLRQHKGVPFDEFRSALLEEISERR